MSIGIVNPLVRYSSFPLELGGKNAKSLGKKFGKILRI